MTSQTTGLEESVVGAVALDLVARVRALTFDIRRLETEIAERTATVAPVLLQVHGVAALLAAKVIGEVAGVVRLRSRHAFARYNGTAPVPVWSGNRALPIRVWRGGSE